MTNICTTSNLWDKVNRTLHDVEKREINLCEKIHILCEKYYKGVDVMNSKEINILLKYYNRPKKYNIPSCLY